MALIALPSEIHLQILALLDYRALSRLRATNMYLYRLPSVDQIAAAMASYECEESLPDYYTARDFYPCYSCLRMLPEGAFGGYQIRFTRAFGHKEYRKRYCFECALRSKWGISGSEPLVVGDGSHYHICRKCYPAKRRETYRAGTTDPGDLCALCGLLCWRTLQLRFKGEDATKDGLGID